MNRRPLSFAILPPPWPLWQSFRCFIMTVLLFCWTSTNAHAERRVALLIGNAAYTQPGGSLKNPVNDVSDMYAKLQTLGFQKKNIVYRENLRVTDIETTLEEFSRKLAGDSSDDRDTVALIYYSGHGMQVSGKNYLPAVDARINSEFSAKRQSIVVSDLMELLASGKSRVNLVFLDSCRDNPFNLGTKSMTRGLSKEEAPSGTWIAYATRHNQVADDGAGRNGTFTAQLLQHIGTPDLPFEQMFKRVGNGVIAATKNKERRQEPWLEGWISGDFYFASAQPSSAPVVVPPVPVPAVAATPPSPKPVAQGPQPGQVPPVSAAVPARPFGSDSEKSGNATRYVDKNGCLREANGSFIVGFRSDCK